MIHTVYLVGAGPGDPGLITVRGSRLLDAAEVVIADRLVAPELLERLGPHVEVIVRGPQRSSLPQDEINRLLVEKARSGRRVVRLKGGDPFVFGRGGEEAEALRAAGIPFAVVPGVTAAIAAPAYAGIPITHRGLAGAVTFVTGHESDDKQGGQVNWEALATGATTLVLYMSVSHLDEVVGRLVRGGRSPATPVAVIERGTTRAQRTIVGTLADIVGKTREAGIAPPALTVVGEVVRMRETLSWFDARALEGPRILQLRAAPEDDASEHASDEASDGASDKASDGAVDALGAIGVEVVRCHALVVIDRSPTVAAVFSRLAGFKWIALTSPHAVTALRRAMTIERLDARALAGLRIAALERPAASLMRMSLIADAVAVGGGRALAQAILDAGGPTGPVLFLRGVGARDELPAVLRAAGPPVAIEAVDAYETRSNEAAVDHALEQHRRRPFAAIAVGSPRCAAAFLDAGPDLSNTLMGALGATTAEALRERGLTVAVVASTPSHGALLSELGAALASRNKLG